MSRSDDIEFRIGANSSRFKREMGVVTRISKLTLNSVSRIAGGLGLSFGAIGIGGFIASVKSLSGEVTNLAAEARTAGLSFETFQELKYAADQNHVSIEALTDGIKELQLRADEFVVAGTGSAVEAFERIGYSAEDLEEALKKPEQLFEDVIDRIAELDTAAQIRVSDELFGGTGGEQFVRLLDQGVGSISRMREEARDLGLIMDQELADKAVEIDRQFELIIEQIGVGLKTAIVNAAWALGDFLNLFNQIGDQSTQNLNDLLKANRESREAYGIEGSEAFERSLKEEERIIGILRERLVYDTHRNLPQPETASIVPVESEDSATTSSKTQVDELTRLIVSMREKTAATLAETAALAELNPLADDYGFQVEKARYAQELLTAAQRSGKEITPELSASIDQLASAYAAASTEAQALAKSQQSAVAVAQEWNDFSKGMLRGFISDMTSGVSVADSLANSLSKVADRLIDIGLNAIFDGGGMGSGIGGLLAHLFSQGGVFNQGNVTPFARGGVVNSPTLFPMAKGMGLMGEAGPEAIMPLTRGRNGELGVRAAGGGGQSGDTYVEVNISVDGAQDATRLVEQLDMELRAVMPRLVKRIRNDPNDMSPA